MPSSSMKTIDDSIGLLRKLPRKREELQKAHAYLKRFKKNHPNTRIDLLVDQPPGSLSVDYDIFIGQQDGSTIAISWRPDNGIPWSAEYADHWAANYVVTVNDRHVTIQQALLFFKYIGWDQSDLMQELVDQQLIFDAIEEHSFSVREEEIQSAANEFRITNGLLTVEATQRWMREMGLSVERFQEILKWGIQAQKLQAHVTRNEEKPYFEAHRKELASIQTFQVETRSKSVANRLIKTARHIGLLSATNALISSSANKEIMGSIIWRRINEIPHIPANPSIGTMVGPVKNGSRYWVAQVLNKHEAQLDTETRAFIRDTLFHSWLANRRNEANVQWHWI